MSRVAPWICILVCLLARGAAANSTHAKQLTELSIEELLSLEVTSVSRHKERWTSSAAAIYVVTGEEIRKMGAQTLPEALRFVPGLQAAQLSASQWAISARGFNGLYANKLLVLIDGRSIYTPLFGGVFWEYQDLALDDIDRIEVIRGPGATLWGANAVSGIINVITKTAAATPGGLLKVGGGNELERSLQLRWGGGRGATHFRVWGKDFDVASGKTTAGEDAFDGWRVVRGGARVDHDSRLGAFSFDLGIASGEFDSRGAHFEPSPPFVSIRDRKSDFDQLSSTARFDRSHQRSNWHTQLNFDRQQQNLDSFEEGRNNLELDFQHHYSGAHQELVWGLSYRRSEENFENNFETRFPLRREAFAVAGGFVQDELALGKSWKAVVGLKLEHNNFTGLETQPSLRLAYSPTPARTLWLAISRAVRFPSRSELEVRRVGGVTLLPGGIPLFTVAQGGHDLSSEELTAYEAGFRFKPSESLFFDLAVYDFDYEHLYVLKPQAPQLHPDYPGLIVPLQVLSGASAESRGVETNLIWQPDENWRLDCGVTYLDITAHNERPGEIPIEDPGVNPRWQAFLRAGWSGHRLETHLGLRWTDELVSLGIPAYWTADLRVGFALLENLHVSAAGRNLTEKHHREFASFALGPAVPSSVERSLSLELEWRF